MILMILAKFEGSIACIQLYAGNLLTKPKFLDSFQRYARPNCYCDYRSYSLRATSSSVVVCSVRQSCWRRRRLGGLENGLWWCYDESISFKILFFERSTLKGHRVYGRCLQNGFLLKNIIVSLKHMTYHGTEKTDSTWKKKKQQKKNDKHNDCK